ncbi:DUF4003 family protein [Bacillus sp. CGMCC 1.16607]|uniref:DUF4003 family protein n=1 Tax=Bacillus sp. CGMCC 1.16607 TaxID=3351842 RepID=UPI003631CFBC
MMNQTLIDGMDQYKDIYFQLYSKLKWKADKRLLMLIAAMYVTSSKKFNLKHFIDTADYIKDEVGFFSQLNSVHRFTTAATLDTTATDAQTAFHHLMSIYDKLIETGFSRNVYSYIAAGTLLKIEPNRIEEYTRKTIDVYKGMKSHHFFLTNSADYPLASILSLNDTNADEIVANVEEYYVALQRKGFSMGNDLQFLSHILTLTSDHNPNEKVELCVKVKGLLCDANFKTKKIFYPYIGMLTYVKELENEVEILKEFNENLNNDKLFKWSKDINFMLSILFLLNQKTSLVNTAQTGLNVSIETLIQAQQAAMTASIAAATAASISSSSS